MKNPDLGKVSYFENGVLVCITQGEFKRRGHTRARPNHTAVLEPQEVTYEFKPQRNS